MNVICGVHPKHQPLKLEEHGLVEYIYYANAKLTFAATTDMIFVYFMGNISYAYCIDFNIQAEHASLNPSIFAVSVISVITKLQVEQIQ